MDNEKFLKTQEIRELTKVSGIGTFEISVDAGSSETRTHVWSDNPKAGNNEGINSAYSVITQSIDGVSSQSNAIYDNLEMTIEDVTSNKDDIVFNKITIVKGGLVEDLRLPVVKTSSNQGKSQQDTTYINTIANIAIRVLAKACVLGKYEETVRPRVTLALPQEDVISAKRQEEIKNKLSGRYIITMPRCKFAVIIEIIKEDILLFDEAQATLGFWRLNNKDKSKDYQNVLIIDAGGRSVDYSLMLKGRVVTRGSVTGKFGGQKFIDLIISRYINETGSDMPTKSMVLDALDTGLLQDGNDTIDITEYIRGAKEEIASNIVNDISSLLDTNEISMKQLNLVLCAGRLMRESENENNKVESLALHVAHGVKKASPSTDVSRVEEEFALVRGLSLARFAYEAAKKKKS